jgi:hypothetical protein
MHIQPYTKLVRQFGAQNEYERNSIAQQHQHLLAGYRTMYNEVIAIGNHVLEDTMTLENISIGQIIVDST